MRGVDTADQLRGTYSCLTKSHKWWHRLFFFYLDTVLVNAWIIHSDLSFRMMEEPQTHLCFHLQLARDLSAKWAGRKHGYSTISLLFPSAHGCKSMGTKRKKCRFCGDRTNQMCPGCDGMFMCKSPCYWDHHW